MRIDLNVISLDVILIARDYVESFTKETIRVRYDDNYVVLDFENQSTELTFNEELSDFIKRKIIAEKTRPIKEMIIGRALYGIVEECN